MQIRVPPVVDQQAKVYDCKTCEVPLALERSRIARVSTSSSRQLLYGHLLGPYSVVNLG
jgi:predicted RNA-binding protein with PUA domain